MALVFAQDGYALCQAAWSPAAPAWIRDIEAMAVLRQVLAQTYYRRTETRGREVVITRDADSEDVPPGRCRPASPHDTDARWAAKGEDLFRRGYKIHLTESRDTPPETETETERHGRRIPNPITDMATTDATMPDLKTTTGIQQRLAQHGIPPASTTRTPATPQPTWPPPPRPKASPWSPRSSRTR